MVSKHVFLYLQLPDYTADYKNLVLAAGPLIYKICQMRYAVKYELVSSNLKVSGSNSTTAEKKLRAWSGRKVTVSVAIYLSASCKC